TKGFQGFTPVSDVNLRVQRGSIHAPLGPHGAGKTPCIHVLTTFLVPTRGTLLFNGVDITSAKPAKIARRAAIRSFQISAVFPHRTVMENVRVGLQRQLGTAYAFWRSEQSLNTLNARAMEWLEQVGLTEFAHTVTVELPYG
ncbi:ATP-binding cassette domain-containing protein, partial [Escherichia coli]|nr:ATP-binding cassette domain-containing protein [Escherichia coli]